MEGMVVVVLEKRVRLGVGFPEDLIPLDERRDVWEVGRGGCLTGQPMTGPWRAELDWFLHDKSNTG